MASETLQQSVTAATIDVIGDDLLHNIVARLPATSFASAACVSRSWNTVCDRVLSRPKLSYACSFSSPLEAAVKEAVSKVLSEPIRPHFAIVSVGGLDKYKFEVLEKAILLITAALGSHVPVITNDAAELIGTDGQKEIGFEFNDGEDSVFLIVGFLPGMKVTTVPLLDQSGEEETFMIDEFVTDIREFSTSVSGRDSPAAIILTCDDICGCMMAVTEKLDYAMSPETVIVGDTSCRFRCTNNPHYAYGAVALVFAVDKNKPPGIGETQFHAVLSSGLSPVGPTYNVRSVREKYDNTTWIAASREGSNENIDAETILDQVRDEIGDQTQYRGICIGVTEKRKCSIGQEKAGFMTSLAFHDVNWEIDRKYFYVFEGGIKKGDTFRLYHLNTTTALSSAAVVSSYLRSFFQGSNNTTGGHKREVFGGLAFTAPEVFGQRDFNSSPFLENFPGVTLAGTFCCRVIGRSILSPHIKVFQEHKVPRCCVHNYCTVYLVMSYTP